MEKELVPKIDGFPIEIRLEADLLGSILLNNDNYYITQEILNPIFFSLPEYGELYRIISHIIKIKNVVTESLLLEYIKSNNLVEKVGGISFIIGLQERIITREAVLETANRIRELYIRRQLMVMYTSGIELCKFSHDDLVLAVTRHSDAINKLVTIGKKRTGDYLRNICENTIIDLVQSESSFFIPTKFNNIDNFIGGGFQPGELVILAARPSIGKTSLGMDFIYNISKQSYNTMVASIEMSSRSLSIRGLSKYSGISYSDILSKRFIQDPELIDKVKHAMNDVIRTVNIFVDDEACSIQEIINSIEAQNRIEPLSVVFIDYLQMIEIPNSRENKNVQISDITRKLKLLASRLNIVVILASQLNREVEKREGGRPILSDLRDSGSIEQDADIIMFLCREDVAKEGEITLIIAKNRNGPRNVATKLLFDGIKTTFKENKECGSEIEKSYYDQQGDDT